MAAVEMLIAFVFGVLIAQPAVQQIAWKGARDIMAQVPTLFQSFPAYAGAPTKNEELRNVVRTT